MHVPPAIQELTKYAQTLTASECRALRAELLAVAAEIGLQVTNKPVRRPGAGAPRLRWPRIGGPGLVVAPNPTIETEEYQSRWRPSDVVIWIYVLGCPGTQALAKALGLPLFKIGTTTTSVQQRLDELGRDAYGSYYRTAKGALVQEPGFGRGLWVAEQLPVSLDLSPLSPVHPSVRGVGIRLPVGLTAAVMERRVAAEVVKAGLGGIIGSAAGRALCAERGVNPARCRRWTEYRFGADTRPSEEEELTIFRPRAESDRLVAIAEKIVVEHVMGLDR
ncbi:MAG: hypothetical protein ACRYGP_09410 [Janthinobacterium lividum]